MTWQLQDAKNKFSELVETTLSDGPQIITRRGKNTVVVINYQDFMKQHNARSAGKGSTATNHDLDYLFGVIKSEHAQELEASILSQRVVSTKDWQ